MDDDRRPEDVPLIVFDLDELELLAGCRPSGAFLFEPSSGEPADGWRWSGRRSGPRSTSRSPTSRRPTGSRSSTPAWRRSKGSWSAAAPRCRAGSSSLSRRGLQLRKRLPGDDDVSRPRSLDQGGALAVRSRRRAIALTTSDAQRRRFARRWLMAAIREGSTGCEAVDGSRSRPGAAHAQLHGQRPPRWWAGCRSPGPSRRERARVAQEILEGKQVAEDCLVRRADHQRPAQNESLPTYEPDSRALCQGPRRRRCEPDPAVAPTPQPVTRTDHVRRSRGAPFLARWARCGRKLPVHRLVLNEDHYREVLDGLVEGAERFLWIATSDVKDVHVEGPGRATCPSLGPRGARGTRRRGPPHPRQGAGARVPRGLRPVPRAARISSSESSAHECT